MRTQGGSETKFRDLREQPALLSFASQSYVRSNKCLTAEFTLAERRVRDNFPLMHRGLENSLGDTSGIRETSWMMQPVAVECMSID